MTQPPMFSLVSI